MLYDNVDEDGSDCDEMMLLMMIIINTLIIIIIILIVIIIIIVIIITIIYSSDLPYEVDISTSGSGRLANKLHWRVWYNTTGMMMLMIM